MIIYLIVESILCIFLISPFLFVALSLVFGKTFRADTNKTATEFDFACVITAYKDATIATNTVHSLLALHYKNFVVYLVADDCNTSEIAFENNQMVVLKPEIALKSKLKSIQYAVANFSRKHQSIVIFDPDNLAHPDCLSEINKFHNLGFKAVQGRRTAKNLDSFYACLDAAGEYYYNYVQRSAPFSLGSSATIAGSGMAILAEDYINFLHSEPIKLFHTENKVIVAEDKMLQVALVKQGNVIAFAKNAIIYDEKVVSGQQVQRQRTRWINSYFIHLKDGLELFKIGIKRLNFNQLYFAYISILPPMFLQVGFAFIFAIINIFYSLPQFLMVTGALFIFAFNFLFTLYLGKAPLQVWKSLWGLPIFMGRQVLALFHLGKSNKDFMVTKKNSQVKLEDLLSTSK